MQHGRRMKSIIEIRSYILYHVQCICASNAKYANQFFLQGGSFVTWRNCQLSVSCIFCLTVHNTASSTIVLLIWGTSGCSQWSVCITVPTKLSFKIGLYLHVSMKMKSWRMFGMTPCTSTWSFNNFPSYMQSKSLSEACFCISQCKQCDFLCNLMVHICFHHEIVHTKEFQVMFIYTVKNGLLGQPFKNDMPKVVKGC